MRADKSDNREIHYRDSKRIKNGNRRRDNEKLEVEQKNHTLDHVDRYVMYEFALYNGKQNAERYDAGIGTESYGKYAGGSDCGD